MIYQDMNNGNNNKIKRITLVDAVVEQMLAAIRSGKFKPGDKIPSEKKLTQEFGVSRTTLREAFKKLELLGTISIRQGDGTYLLDSDNILPSEPSFDDSTKSEYIQETIHSMFSIGNYQLTHYLEAREYLEKIAMELAIERANQQDFERLEEILAKQDHVLNDSDAFAQLDYDFHKTIIITSKNEFLYQFWLSLAPFIKEQVYKVSQVPGMIANAINSHNKIYHAMKYQQTKKAKNLIIEHFRIIPGRMLSEVIKQVNSSEHTNQDEN